MEWFVFYIAFCAVVAVAASSRGRSGIAWFFIGLLISPLLGIILVLVMPNLKASAGPPVAPAFSSDNTGALKTCPRCAETVKRAAQACRFCGHEFDGSELKGQDRRVYRGFEYFVQPDGRVTRGLGDAHDQSWWSEDAFRKAVDSMDRR